MDYFSFLAKKILEKKNYIIRFLKEKHADNYHIHKIYTLLKELNLGCAAILCERHFNIQLEELAYLKHKREWYFDLFIKFLKKKKALHAFILSRKHSQQVLYSYKIMPHKYLSQAFQWYPNNIYLMNDIKMRWGDLNEEWLEYLKKYI